MAFKKWCLVVGITLQTFSCFAQYFQFSQFNYTGQRINPASVSATDYASAKLLYRQQKSTDDLEIKSTYLEGSYPIFNKKGRLGGLGLSLSDDRSGFSGMFRTQEIGVSYALSIPLKKYSSLNLGFRTVYQNKKIALDGLTTGYQYVLGHGMVGDNNGEDIDNFRTDFLTFSSGLYWKNTDKHNNTLAHAGLSLFDFNQPQESFYNSGSKLSATLMINAGLQAYESDGFSIFPEFLMTYSGYKALINIGPVFTYDFYKGMRSNKPGKINLITKYASGNYLIAGLQFEKEKFAFGFSYDVPVGSKLANEGAIEFGAEFKQLVKNTKKKKSRKHHVKKKKTKHKKKAKKKSKKKKKKTNQKPITGDQDSGRKTTESSKQGQEKEPKQESQREKATTTEQAENGKIAQENADKKEVTKNTEKIGSEIPTNQHKLNQSPLEMENTLLYFNFEFGKVQLNEGSKEYLRNLANVLKEDELLKVTIVGHTDDVGSDSYNKALSVKRAQVVAEFLNAEGVSENKIVVEGKGETEPLVENNSPENRAKNRRVDFKIGY